MKRTTVMLLIALLSLGLLLVACDGNEETLPQSTTVAQQECPTCPACPEGAECPECPEAEACPECPEAEACPECPEAAALTCPHADEWATSPHADAESEAFRHWDEEDPAEVPVDCAQCHSSTGFQDYVGADGSTVRAVDAAAPLGTVVDCAACHNDGVNALQTVIFPSGAEVDVEDPSTPCFICHQGRAWGGSITEAAAEAGLAEEPDTPSEELGFVNIHYYAAAATLFGGITNGGYQYEGQSYDTHLAHVEAYDTCTECHDSHTLDVKADECAACHSEGDFKDIRMTGSLADYDGDGDIEEGVYYEIEGLQQALYDAIQAYASEVLETPVAYSAAAYPYFFVDTNANGELEEEEAAFPNAFKSWSPRLLAAAYNYQTSIKDPGGYAHGGKYFIQLLHDSIASLNEMLATPVDMSAMARIDPGHFAGSEEAFRHWDADGMVEGGCATCHSARGLPFIIEHEVQIEQPLSNGLECETCHVNVETFETFSATEVVFPSGAAVTTESPDANLCLFCHQGRSFGGSVDAAVEGMEPDTPSDRIRFVNIHYFAAGATLYGSEVEGAYQYPDKEYSGKFVHVGQFDTCIECHDPHALQVRVRDCGVCHDGVVDNETLLAIRLTNIDYDGDGDTEEGMAAEIQSFGDALYAAIQAYAADTAQAPILYSSARYPYFFGDTNDNGEIDEGEGNYTAWTPQLLRAGYNYQYYQKDPGAFAHNPSYVMQFLHDSIEALGGDVSGLTRPEVEVAAEP